MNNEFFKLHWVLRDQQSGCKSLLDEMSSSESISILEAKSSSELELETSECISSRKFRFKFVNLSRKSKSNVSPLVMTKQE